MHRHRHLRRLPKGSELLPSPLRDVKCKYRAPNHLLDDLDVDTVFSLTFDNSHEFYAVQALKAGKHVFQENLLALSLASLQRIVQAERRLKFSTRPFLGYKRRYSPCVVNPSKYEVAGVDRICLRTLSRRCAYLFCAQIER